MHDIAAGVHFSKRMDDILLLYIFVNIVKYRMNEWKKERVTEKKLVKYCENQGKKFV